MLDVNLQIESLVKEKNISYIEATIEFAEDKDLEYDYLSTFLNRSTKEKIQFESEERNLLKNTSERLPI